MKIKRLNKNLPLPCYANDGDAGLDLCANLDEPLTIYPGEKFTIPTGIAVEIPQFHYGLLLPRSGLGTKFDIVLANTAGVIDSKYRGEIKAIVRNRGTEPYVLKPMERFVQLIIQPYLKVTIEDVEELEETDRGANGFGSSGS